MVERDSQAPAKRTTVRVPRGRALALAGMLAAATLTGGALVAVLSSQPASRPTPVRPVALVSKQPVSAAALMPSVRWTDGERGDDG